MVEFRKVVQIGTFKDGEGMTRPHFRELDKGETAEPQAPKDEADPEVWVEAFLRDMPNASILHMDRLRKWFSACWSDGYQNGLDP
jgi:hypothetical protein